MSNERVDTDRPEYSWIPFFEELAWRIDEGDGRERQPEIVAELKRMREDGLRVHSYIEKMDDSIDPFSLIAMIFRNLTWENRRELIEGREDAPGYRQLFKVEAAGPKEDPFVPYVQSIAMFYFRGNEPVAPQVETHWSLFEEIMDADEVCDESTIRQLVPLMDQSLAVGGVGMSKLTSALYWIRPHDLLHVDTIVAALGRKTGVEVPYPRNAGDYFDLLCRLKDVDTRPFPEINNTEYLLRRLCENPDDVGVWLVHAGEKQFAVDDFVGGKYAGIHFDLNHVDIGSFDSREELERVCVDDVGYLEPGDNRLTAIGQFVFDISPGDIVVTRDPETKRFHYGLAASTRTYLAREGADGDIHKNRRTVYWRGTGQVDGILQMPIAVSRVLQERDPIVSQVVALECNRRTAQESAEDVGGLTQDVPIDAQPNVWLVRSGVGGVNADTVVSGGYIGIGWEGMDIGGCRNKGELDTEWDRAYPERSPSKRPQEVGSISRFVFGIAVGDYVVTTNNQGGFHVGEIKGETTFDNDDGLPFPTRREVQWFSGGPHPKNLLPAQALLGVQTVLELRGDKRDAVLWFINVRKPEPAAVPYTIDTMLSEGVFAEREDLERMLDLLQRKKSLILQGPPGTGKTFIARKLAYVLMGEKDDRRVSSVQFHQSYSYEDFVGGYKPTTNDREELVFTSEGGAFLRVCDRARAYEDDVGEDGEPEVKYVMLIDEINRGNLSRVFGELLMLIESDKRNPDNAIELQHLKARGEGADDGRFYVPPNVYIIGTMNLADRSLTGMNVAMRRRFGFVELEPQFDTDRFRDWIANETGMPDHVRDRIIDRMESLNARIGGDPELGKQYAVGHSFFVPDREAEMSAEEWERWYEMIVDHEIKPLLEEYWFDKLDVAADEARKLRSQ